MNKLVLACVLGMVLMTGACAHKSGSGCKDGSCSMAKAKDHKEACGCGHEHKADAQPAEPAKK